MNLSNEKSQSLTVAESDTSCEAAISMIGNYLADSITPRMRDDFERHLTLCPDCKAFLQTYKKTIEVTRALLRSQTPNPGPRGILLRHKHVRPLMALTLWLHLFLANVSLMVG